MKIENRSCKRSQSRKNQNISISSDSVYDSVAYDLMKTKLSESEAEAEEPTNFKTLHLINSIGQRSTGTRQWPDKYNVVSFYLKLLKNKRNDRIAAFQQRTKKQSQSHVQLPFSNSLGIISGSTRRKVGTISGSGSFRGRFGDHFRVGTISGGCTALSSPHPSYIPALLKQ